MSGNTHSVRILHVFGGMNRGGAETFVMNLYRRIDRTRFQFDFAVNTNASCDYDDEIRDLGGRILPHPAPLAAGFVRWTREFERTLTDWGPFDAVHSHVHWFSGFALRAAKSKGIPVRIAHSHSTQDGKHDSIARKVYEWTARRLLQRHATLHLGCTRTSCESLYGIGCWKDPRTRVVHNAIDIDSYEKLSGNAKEDLRRELSIPVHVPVLGHVGRFSPVKNHARIIEIFSLVQERCPGAFLVLIGDGPQRPLIAALTRRLGISDKVLFLGIRSDIPRLLHALDLVLFPSIYEGLPLALVEAQAAGLSCVVSRTVSEEVDIGVGLVSYVSLDENTEIWAKAVLDGLKRNPPDWGTRKTLLASAGFDVRSLLGDFERWYTCDAG